MSTQAQELPIPSEMPGLPDRSTKPIPGLEGARESETQPHTTSVLDEPWRVAMLPEQAKLPPGVLPAPGAQAIRSQPWRRGDVTRLKEDTPEGMMRYIATHTTGWWQEMAERALRDTEKATRMAREAGWQHGQYWTLEVDAEAKERMRAQEEGRRAREEAERAREQAEKEAFAQRQMELLKKAGRAPRCEHVYTDGRGCRAPQVKGERWCHGHAKMMSYRPEKLELALMEDENAVMLNLYRVTQSLLSGRITEKMAGLMLWSVAIAAPCVKRVKKNVLAQRTQRTRRKGKGSPQTNADGKSKPKTFETRRNGVSGGSNGHPGVTRRKSFRSAVAGGGAVRRTGGGRQHQIAGTTKIAGTTMKNRRSLENSLKWHDHDRHSRGPSTSPQSRGALGASRDDNAFGNRNRKQTSASPRLPGEFPVRPTEGTAGRSKCLEIHSVRQGCTGAAGKAATIMNAMADTKVTGKKASVQGLKPKSIKRAYGTAEAVPCYESVVDRAPEGEN